MATRKRDKRTTFLKNNHIEELYPKAEKMIVICGKYCRI